MATRYYLTGPDGCGKTTYLKELTRHFSQKGLKTEHVWMRSPKILSKPLMAYCRLVGLTEYMTIEGIKYGGHFFHKSKFVSRLYPRLQLIDFRIKMKAVSKIFDSELIVLMDRFSLDTLADLMADTERFDLHQTRTGRMFMDLIPGDTKIIVLSASQDNIRKRKVDTLHDPLLEKRIKAYTILSKDLGLDTVDNNRDFQVVKKEIFHKFLL